MAQVRVDFQGRGNVQALSWARVQAIGNGVQLALLVAPQVRPLGEVLAQQALSMLVGAARPGVHARPALSPDHKSAVCAATRAHAGVSW